MRLTRAFFVVDLILHFNVTLIFHTPRRIEVSEWVWMSVCVYVCARTTVVDLLYRLRCRFASRIVATSFCSPLNTFIYSLCMAKNRIGLIKVFQPFKCVMFYLLFFSSCCMIRPSAHLLYRDHFVEGSSCDCVFVLWQMHLLSFLCALLLMCSI